MSLMLDELYQEVLMDHFRRPRCAGCINNPSSAASLFNPLCGDQVHLSLRIVNDTIEDMAFSGHGCSISQASASMMGELCKGKSVEEVRKIQSLFRGMMRGEKCEQECESLGDAAVLSGVRKFSARVKCAALAWEALDKCIDEAIARAKPA